jgi:hypothetical protein
MVRPPRPIRSFRCGINLAKGFGVAAPVGLSVPRPPHAGEEARAGRLMSLAGIDRLLADAWTRAPCTLSVTAGTEHFAL